MHHTKATFYAKEIEMKTYPNYLLKIKNDHELKIYLDFKCMSRKKGIPFKKYLMRIMKNEYSNECEFRKEDIMKLDICDEAKNWLGSYDDMQKAWNECNRGDWMLYLIGKIADKPGSDP